MVPLLVIEQYLVWCPHLNIGFESWMWLFYQRELPRGMGLGYVIQPGVMVPLL